jgi:hypothetical protein
MRGDERIQEGKFSYFSLEQRVPADHPLREVRKSTDTVLRSLSAELDELYGSHKSKLGVFSAYWIETLGLAQYSAEAMTALNRCFSF